jgi:hypothetical protein
LPVDGTPSNILTVETNDDVVTPETIGNDVGRQMMTLSLLKLLEMM